MKTVLQTLISQRTLWNPDANVKNISAGLSRIFSWWNSFKNSFEACFNFDLIIFCTSHSKRKNIVLKGIIIVACDKTILQTLISPRTLWNPDANVKNISAGLSRILSWWNSFKNSFEACFNFDLIIFRTSHSKRKKTVF